MTESTFPFEAAAEPETETSARSNRKAALVAGAGALGVAVLGYFVVVPMISGSGGHAAEPVAVVHHRAPGSKAGAKKAATKPAVVKPLAQPATYADVSARQDPFAPLVLPPAAPAAAPADASAPTTGSAPAAPASGSSTSVAGQRVALLHVYSKDGKQYAQTKVGDVVYTPSVGGVFGTSFKLLATSGKTATYLFGDEQFSLSEGQEVLK